MYQIPLQRIIQLTPIHHLPIQQRPFAPPHLPTPLLVDEQSVSEQLRLDLQEIRQFVQIHGRVQFQVRLDGRGEHRVLHLGHEDRGMVVHRVDVERRVVEIWWRGRDEFRACASEELFEQGEAFRPAPLETSELLAILLAEGGMDGIVEFGWRESDADGDEGVHLVILLADAVVLLTFIVVLRSAHVDEDVAEHADGIGVSAKHHVAEADIVVGGEVGGHYSCEHGFLVQLDVIEGLEGEGEVAE